MTRGDERVGIVNEVASVGGTKGEGGEMVGMLCL